MPGWKRVQPDAEGGLIKTASVFPHWVLQGLPGIHADHSASDWEFLKPIYVNDKITPTCYFVGYDMM